MTFAYRDTTLWKLKTQSIALGERTRVMGILNVTPDSFSDGGAHFDTARAIEHGLSMFADGADIVDIGGESTRPGKYAPETAATEQGRVLPVIEGIVKALRGVSPVLSIDTYHAETAIAAIHAGAEIVNDVSGFLWDDGMASTCARLGCGVVLMHTRGRPEEWKHLARLRREEVLPMVTRELGDRLRSALEAGVLREHILLDPGFGFGKAFGENYPLLAGLESLRKLGQPVLAGVSRKSFLGRTLASLHHGVDAPADARGNASIAAMVAAILAGADVVRVHEVKPAVEAARIADAVLAASAEA
jgi:dihydropteroate synthase